MLYHLKDPLTGFRGRRKKGKNKNLEPSNSLFYHQTITPVISPSPSIRQEERANESKKTKREKTGLDLTSYGTGSKVKIYMLGRGSWSRLPVLKGGVLEAAKKVKRKWKKTGGGRTIIGREDGNCGTTRGLRVPFL